MASTVWKGYLSFGLISIPIRLYAAARPERVSFRQIVKETMQPIKQQLFSPELDRVVERKELAKGYEVAKDEYILIDEEEIKKIAPQSSSTMEILEFVKIDEIDPLYFDSSYYTTPDEAGRKPYALLTKAMQESGYCAIAKISMHQREHTVVVRPYKGGMTLHTMFYADEVRDISEYGPISDVEIKDQELKLAEQLIDSLAKPFDPEEFSDSYRTKVQEMINAKIEGRESEAEPTRRLAPVVDLMEALQKSLGEKAEKKSPQRAETSEAPKKTTKAKSRKAASRKKATA
ncbi:MAG: Ku protein [Acidobacteria bacterium]|nr:Ku protein [Acidobacteriota bacterium]